MSGSGRSAGVWRPAHQVELLPCGADDQGVGVAGPFAGTKEQLGGVFVVECADRDEAVRWALEVPSSPGLVVEVRPLATMSGMTMIDASTSTGAHVLERLEREPIGWMTTVTPDGQPQTLPMWFVWEDGTILVYSKKVAARNRNLHLNPKISFHLADREGDDILEIEGEAARDPDAPPSKDHPGYQAKYAGLLARYGWTPEYLSEEYPHPFRIRPSVVRIF